MPLQKLQFRPGLNREGTDYANEGGWYDGDKIRFRSGFPEKIGGWTRLSNNQYLGTARAMWNWADLAGNNYLGVGTNLKYYIEAGGTYNDITPIVFTNVYTNKLSTAFSTLNGNIGATDTSINLVSGINFPTTGLIKIDSEQIFYTGRSGNTLTGCVRGYNGTTAASHSTGAAVGCATITWNDTDNDANNGDFVIISGASAIGGIPADAINKEFQVTKLYNSTDYFTTSAFSTSEVLNAGGAATFQYELPIGLDVYTTGTGWGASPWGGVVSPVTTTLGSNPFACTSGSPTVTVTHTAHGFSNGIFVAFSGATAVDSIPATMLNNTFQISNVTTNTYDITLPSGFTASSTTTGGGANVIELSQSGSAGWGTGYTTGIGQQLRLWSNDNYGQDLVIAPRGGGIYYWQDAGGVGTRAQPLGTLATSYGYAGTFVPHTTNQVVASAIQRFVIAMGANSYDPLNANTVFDPMLVRWSDQENPYDWVPNVTNQSGEFRLTNGSYIMGARSTRQEILVWTDSAIYSMQYLGAPYVWGFQILMDNISVISPNSMVTVNNVTYWMGTDKFYMYSGRVETLPCSLRQYIFDDINKEQAYQIFAGGNEGYNEVWWFYVSNSSSGTAIDKYVIYNYLDRVWYYGSMARTAWLDSGIRQYPMAANYENRILYHESAVDDVSGLTPVPINAYVQSSDFDIGDGHNFGFVWRILPDVNFNGSNVNQPYVTMTVKPRQNSGTPYGVADNPVVQSADNYSTRGVYNIQQFDGQVYTRLRGRQLSFRIESNSLGVSWQLGTPRIDIRNDGRR